MNNGNIGLVALRDMVRMHRKITIPVVVEPIFGKKFY